MITYQASKRQFIQEAFQYVTDPLKDFIRPHVRYGGRRKPLYLTKLGNMVVVHLRSMSDRGGVGALRYKRYRSRQVVDLNGVPYPFD